ncbi:hypothetical protein [Lysinibacillus fusiformis]|uniref:flagellin N-terminal helical domain-containing protein n=1 Tax=Lysinibacillus fusiformis TaxID=28031 RepID=UPI003CFFCF5B
MRIRHNISSLNTNNKLQIYRGKTEKSLEKLTSGFKINRAGDDAAGLAISEKMRGQIRGLNMAGKNIQDGISLIQTAESGLSNIQDPNLQRLRELAIQSANDTLTDEDRRLIQKEVEQLKHGINNISNNTEFNGIKLLNRTSNVTNYPIDLTFKSIDSGSTETFFGIAYSGNTYVAVGGNGAIFTSTDGENWDKHSLPVSDLLSDVEWDGNKFIAVGTYGRIITSTDGISWNSKKSGTAIEFWDIEYNGSTYVAVGLDGQLRFQMMEILGVVYLLEQQIT